MDIDFVITWVDGSDSEWKEEKAKYEDCADGDTRDKRYREWGFLKYWFRSIEKYAPWVRYIYFVTCGHIPVWINQSNPKLRIVKHSDFIPEEYLPTFSCRPIELNLHRIPDLAEHFVYFNDDMFLLQPATQRDFFKKNLPCDAAILDAGYIDGGKIQGNPLAIDEYNTSPVMNMVPLNRNFEKKKVIRANTKKWYSLSYGKHLIRTILLVSWKHFTGIKSFHLPYSYLKKTFDEVWEKEADILRIACSHKFRNSMDVSSRLFSYWQLARGDFSPRSPKIGKYFSITDDIRSYRELIDIILKRKYKLICVNDECTGKNFELIKKELNCAFESILPDISSFER